LTATVNHQPDAIGLIDGVFLQSLSVWHKEILFVLERGIPIYGASSMGALRATETAAFGMIGVGQIFRQYESGQLIDDDEVALAHATAEQDYRPTSEPMVNVRATFSAAENAGIINSEEHARLIAIAKGIYFIGRTFPSIFDAALSDGLSAETVRKLGVFVSTNYVDLKRQDAIELLQTIKTQFRNGTRSVASHPPFVARHSTAFETLYNRDRRVECGATSLPLESISNYVALHDPDFDELNFSALNRMVVFNFSQVFGIEASAATIDAEYERFRKRRELDDEATLSAWLEENHLSQDELRALVTQIAACRVMHRWLLIAMWMGRTTKAILDELRLKGEYREWAEKAAAQERLLQNAGESDGAATTWNTLEEFLNEHQQWTDFRVDIDCKEWAEEAGFHSDSNLKLELSRANAARRALLDLLAGVSSTETNQEKETVNVAGNR
jgi:hypothetical protein